MFIDWMREFLLRTPSEIESLFCKLGSYLAHKSIRFNHFMSAFPFMGSSEEAIAQDHARCPLIVEWCPVGIQIWPTNQKSLQKFVFQLLYQNVGSSPPPPNPKSAFSCHFYIWFVPDESALDSHRSIPGAALSVCVPVLQGKAHGPFIHVEATKDPCPKAHCVLCVCLLKFRLC